MNISSMLTWLNICLICISGSDQSTCPDRLILKEPNQDYSSYQIYEFPGLVRNPLWTFTSVSVNISCLKNGQVTDVHYFVADCNETACEKYERQSWLYSESKNGTIVQMSPFSKTLIGISPERSGSSNCFLRLSVKKVEVFYVAVLFASLLLFFLAPFLSRSTKVHYSSGTLVGVFGFLLVLAYLLAKLIPGKKAMSGLLYFTGWSLTAYLVRIITNDLTLLLPYLLCYMGVAGAISFAGTYYYGPITNPRAQQLICYSLRAVCFGGIYYSVQLESLSFSLMLILLARNYIPLPDLFPRGGGGRIGREGALPGLAYLRLKWYTRFPPKKRLLTVEEFELEGQRETAKALEELRLYCMQQEAQPWKLVRKLNQPDRMASFVEGDSHVTLLEQSTHEEMLVSSPLYSSDEECQNGPLDNNVNSSEDDDQEDLSPDSNANTLRPPTVPSKHQVSSPTAQKGSARKSSSP